jgi:methionine biosynthesis protein MetW
MKLFPAIKRVFLIPYNVLYQAFIRPMPLNDFENYDEYWSRRQTEGRMVKSLYRYEYVVSRLPENGKLLDVGCGDGAFLEFLTRRKPGISVKGLDQAKKMVEMLVNKGIKCQQISLGIEDFADIDFEPDWVTFMEVLEHIPEAEKVLLQISSIVKKSIFISVPNMGYLINRLRLLGGKVPITNIVCHIKEHVRFWTYSDFKYWCEFLGFEVVHISGQYYGFPLLWKFWPSLFAKGLIAEIKPSEKKSIGE